jgi:hypothetical protein
MWRRYGKQRIQTMNQQQPQVNHFLIIGWLLVTTDLYLPNDKIDIPGDESREMVA